MATQKKKTFTIIISNNKTGEKIKINSNLIEDNEGKLNVNKISTENGGDNHNLSCENQIDVLINTSFVI